MDITNVLKKAVPLFDGGFHFAGIVGNGDAFAIRDAHGIRPSYYYISDESSLQPVKGQPYGLRLISKKMRYRN